MSFKKNLTLHFYELNSLEEQQKSLDIYLKYFDTLEQALEKFNQIHNKNITELFNQYGQKIPLTYRVQKTGLCLYF
jgi:hypothetical protein